MLLILIFMSVIEILTSTCGQIAMVPCLGQPPVWLVITIAWVHHSKRLFMRPVRCPTMFFIFHSSNTSTITPKCHLSMAFPFYPVIFFLLPKHTFITHTLTARFRVGRGISLSEAKLAATITALFSTAWSMAIFVQCFGSCEKICATEESWGKGSLINPLLPSSCSKEITVSFWQEDLDFFFFNSILDSLVV